MKIEFIHPIAKIKPIFYPLLWILHNQHYHKGGEEEEEKFHSNETSKGEEISKENFGVCTYKYKRKHFKDFCPKMGQIKIVIVGLI